MNKKILNFVFIFALLLTGCSYTSLVFEPYTYDVNYSNMKKERIDDNYYSLDEYKSLKYLSPSGEKLIESYRDLYSSKSDKDTREFLNISSHGEQYLLVIPVSFLDSNKNDQDKKKIIIQNAFFGQSSKTIYESVASYYDKSSYGDLKIKGEVVDFINFPSKASELESKYGSYTRASRYVVAWLIDYLKEQNFDFSKYDNDKDGYIDGVYVIYDYPYSEKTTNSLFWAYTDQTQKNLSGLNSTKPYASSYSWSSYDFIKYNNNFANSHTLIHEVGHLFGLIDYYNTNSSAFYQPTGYMDMMDFNVGDHSGFSKMILDWVTPKVVTGEGDITLSPFYNSGELILIPAGEWNGTPYDEYLLLEYFAPQGLNEKEQAFTFSYIDKNGDEKDFSYLSYYGIKVYHVDARLAYFESKTSSHYICFLDDKHAEAKLINYTSYCVDFAFSNSVDNFQINNKPTLLHLLQSSGENTFIEGEPMKNEDLWILGDTFGVDTFTDFTFNNNEKLPFTFEISKFNTNQATISFKIN